jgi:hypothetical protein
MNDKIRISWDDVNSQQVDSRLQQQQAVQHAQQHYAQYASPYASPQVPGGTAQGGSGHLLYNSMLYMTFFGAVGALLAWGAGEVLNFFSNTWVDGTKLRLILADMLWISTLATIISFFISLAEPLVSRNLRGVIINGCVGICAGLIGGLFVGSWIDLLYWALGGGGAEMNFTQVAARTIGWAIAGGFVAIAPGIVLLNWKRLVIGLAGGFIGGLMGGILFDVVARLTNTDIISRFIGVCAIGFFTGLGTGLIENVAKTGWLRVAAGLIAGKQFILYRNPTYIGSSPQCEIYLFKDLQVSPRHAAIHRVGSGYDLEDQGSASGTFVNGRPIARTRLRNNDQVQIGGTVFVFQERAQAGAA